MEFNSAIVQFLNSQQRNLQLDLFRSNGQVVLQMFKAIDVVNWDIDFIVRDNQSIIIELDFNKHKTNNDLNFSRFLESSFFDKFVQGDSKSKGSYFHEFEINSNQNSLDHFIQDLLNAVYGDIEINFTLNAY